MKFLLFLTFPISFLLFLPSLRYYFFQDDWFVLNWTRTGDLLSYILPRTDIIYYRPISMPILFKTVNTIFPLNPFAFHLVAFAIFCALIVSVYVLFNHLGFDKKISTLGAFLYGTWPIHYISLSWLSTTSYIIGPLFQVLSFINFIKFTKGQKLQNYVFSFFFFLMAILSSEFTFVLPIIFWLYLRAYDKKTNLIQFMPYIAICLIYLFIRIILSPIPARDDYGLLVNLQLLNNYLWYILWGLGLPERFKTLLYFSTPKQSLKVIFDFAQVAIPTIILTLSLSLVAIRNLRENLKPYIFGILWLTIGLAPVLLLTNHAYPLYLSFAGIGLLFILLNAFAKTPSVFLAAIVLLWLVSSYSNLIFTRTHHWVKDEQAISKSYVDYVRQNVNTSQSGSILYFKHPDLEFTKKHNFTILQSEDTLKLSLSDQNAMQVIFNNSYIQSVFDPKNQGIKTSEDKTVIEILPK